MQSTTSLIISSLLLVGCAGIQRPDTVLYGVNTKSQTLRGYNLKEYDDDGNRKPNAKLYVRPLSDLKDGWIVTDPEGLKNLKVFLHDLRNRAKECK